ncbi:MAG: Fic family protein [Solirubrobacteraceae bacterium]|nr:Fic family protein [Solirubrobacteraceae bacterium]
MPSLVKARWDPTPDLGLPRHERAGCVYEAYVPDALGGRSIVIGGETAADVADAERAVVALQAEATGGLADSEALARLLLRAEAVASSRIEGLQIGGRRLLRAQLAARIGVETGDATAVEILGNIDAMGWAVEAVGEGDAITVDVLCEVHRRLVSGTTLERHGGVVRDVQNWIGGSSYNPCSAVFVPPPPDAVPTLLEDLCRFCDDDRLPAVVQAAIAHAQFETIHPFVDGNGRTGRALIAMILRRRGLVTRILPPVSLVLATRADDYVAGLTAMRYGPGADERQVRTATDRWIASFAAAVTRAVRDAHDHRHRVGEIQAGWRRSLDDVRSDSAARRLVDALPGAPVITVQTAAALIGRSVEAANNGVALLLRRGILRQITVGRRNRAFEAPELIEAFTVLERRLASPAGDTVASPPARPVPPRPPRTP